MITHCNNYFTDFSGRQSNCSEDGNQCPSCQLEDAEAEIEKLKEPALDCRTCKYIKHDYHSTECRFSTKCVEGSFYEHQRNHNPLWKIKNDK